MSLDRRFLSRYSSATFAINVYRGGALADADAAVTGTLLREGDTTPAWTRDATTPATGVYEVALSSADTVTPGEYTLTFNYTVDGQPQVYGYDIEIGQSSPAYDALGGGSDWAGVVEGVWAKFADLFDSPYGGPNLQTYMQTNFGRNRLAQLLPAALQRLNSATVGHASYAVGATGFPFGDWGGLLQQSLYIEVLKHLVRSYTEQPEVILGTAVSRVDRRDYTQRWREVLDMETTEFERDLSRYRLANLGLGNVSVLVSGGAFGKLGPWVNAGGAGEAAARGYFAVRRPH